MAVVFFLAYANGANDNFKGCATLMGSGTSDYRNALLWGTLTTASGSLTALILAQGLVTAFSGKGLVPESVVIMKSFSLSVIFAASMTIMLATKFGFPISTTHALTGALVGAGLTASPTGVDFSRLGTGFFMPLLFSPLLAIVLTAIFYPALRATRIGLNVTKETCVCIGTEVEATPQYIYNKKAAATATVPFPVTTIGDKTFCRERYRGQFLGVEVAAILDGLHYLSAGVVSFARGLNDTPKIAAVLLAGSAVSPYASIAGVIVFMTVGGLLNARKVADTMAHRITAMNAGQGLTANLITGVLVIIASKHGLPVSTTHVSCGSLFGIGAVTKQAQWKMIAAILTAWLTTLPVAAFIASGTFLIFRMMFV